MTIVEEVDVTTEYNIKFLNESHLNQILCLQDIVTKKLSDPTSYYVEPIQFFRKQLAIEKGVLGIFHKDDLVGFNTASFPGIDEENLGRDIGLKPEELVLVSQLGPTVVHPDHRKKGILTRIVKIHLQVLKEIGYRHICCTVAPNNYPTIRSNMANGLIIKQLKLKYNNVLRYIMHLDLENPLRQPPYSMRIPYTDIESQKFMFSLGFYGYDALKNDNGFELAFGRDEMKV